MEFSAHQLAGFLNGSIEGDVNVMVNSLSRIEEGKPGSISFLANPLYTQHVYTSNASIIIVNEDFVPAAPVKATLIRVKDAQTAFTQLLEMYNQVKLDKKGISNMACINASSLLGENVYIGEFASIGAHVKLGNNVKIYPHVYVGDNTVIGDNTTVFPGVKIYSDSVIGKRCIVHANTVIGSDGFRFATENHKKIPQIGNVIIEDDVEIGASCAIDRATLGSTILRKGVKFDNLVHIAHNVEVGENTYIAAACVVAGSTKIGANCMFSGQVGVVGHLTVADNTILAAQSGVSKSIAKKGEAHLGSPAFEISKYRKAYIHFRNLEKIVDRIDKLEKK